MEISKFLNFETSCLCEVCSKCKIKNLKNFLKERDFFNSFCYNYYYDFFSNFVNPIHVILNYIEYHNYFIEKDSIRPQKCCLFEKYQLIDINGSIPWCMKNHIKDCFNNWENFCNSDIPNLQLLGINILRLFKLIYIKNYKHMYQLKAYQSCLFSFREKNGADGSGSH